MFACGCRIAYRASGRCSDLPGDNSGSDFEFNLHDWRQHVQLHGICRGSLLANDVDIAPDASNPDSAGFILSPRFSRGASSFGLTGGATEAVELDILYYTVSVTNSASGESITGATSVANGAVVSWTDDNNNLVKALNSNFLAAGLCNVEPQAGIVEENSFLLFNAGSVTDDTLPNQGCKNSTQESAQAELFFVAQNGVASLTSGGFYVDDAAGTSGGGGGGTTAPEPSSLLLLGSGLIALAISARRQKRLES